MESNIIVSQIFLRPKSQNFSRKSLVAQFIEFKVLAQKFLGIKVCGM